MDHVEQTVCELIAIAKMMVCGNRHPIPQSGSSQSGFQIRLEFVAVVGIVCTRSEGGPCFGTIWSMFPDAFERYARQSIDNRRHHSTSSISNKLCHKVSFQ
jgi:hypothetical protein